MNIRRVGDCSIQGDVHTRDTRLTSIPYSITINIVEHRSVDRGELAIALLSVSEINIIARIKCYNVHVYLVGSRAEVTWEIRLHDRVDSSDIGREGI